MTAGRFMIFAVLAFLGAGAAAACERSSGPPPGTLAPTVPSERPALAVMVVVDQLAEPLLQRYDDLFTGGFRRLLDDGRFYVNAAHDHAVTKTAPGHATLSTGVYPSRHGIVANEWFERMHGRWVEVENVRDSTVGIVGHPELPGVSPHRLMRPGLADWLEEAEPMSLVASVSAKDRGAVQPAAHVRGEVWWFEDLFGRFVTSTYYRDSLPAWAERFHATRMAAYAADSVWASTIPDAARGRSRPDTAAWEGDGVHTWFPHLYAIEGDPGAYWEWFADTPFLDAATLDFAETLVAELGMGRDSVPDFLNVSVSQTDRVGHDYGPWSREQLDNLLRLDRELGEFFDFLDATVGRGRWVVALSADHGVLPAPEALNAPGDGKARRMTVQELALLDSLAEPGHSGASATAPDAPESLVAFLEKLDFVADAWTRRELEEGQPADSFAVLARHSLYPGRAGAELGRRGVVVRFVPELIEDELGTGHGSPYWYDRHVPMVFLGPGIPPGRDPARASTVDFAPTLARILGIPYPDDLDGAPLEGVVGPAMGARRPGL
ncbi:MAG: alkaline phosphatase family protein [Gemmatimonadota bacterium]